MILQLKVDATDGAARVGRLQTPRGSFAVPAFMPVGTRGSVRAVSSADMENLGAEVMLANAYHLMLRPGVDVVAGLGGLHAFTSWPGHLLTDSGGYQVYSLGPKVDDDGVTFRSIYDGSSHRLTPEGAVRVQEQLGADIQMVLDVCPALPSPPDVLRLAVERTAAWAARAKLAHHRVGQALFGIVQGGTDEALRAESARRTVELDFEGYGIGGLAVGEGPEARLAALASAVTELPTDRPRYLMGVGDPVGLVEAVAMGVDLFDCVAPTRWARHGRVLTGEGPLQLRNAAFRCDPGPLDPDCRCVTCSRWSRAYLRHLLMVGEPSALRLLSLHNLAWTLNLMEKIREAVRTGTLGSLRRQVASVWDAARSGSRPQGRGSVTRRG